MKKKDLEQLKSKNRSELTKRLDEDRDKLWTLKTDLASGKVKNVREIKRLRADIARVLTLLKDHPSDLK
jgi:ribosomal protein L29